MKKPPAWHGEIELEFVSSPDNSTILSRSYAIAPLKVQRPFYPEADVCQTVLLHSAGGMVGGDRLSAKIDLSPNSRALIGCDSGSHCGSRRKWWFPRNQKNQTAFFFGSKDCAFGLAVLFGISGMRFRDSPGSSCAKAFAARRQKAAESAMSRVMVRKATRS